MKPALQDTIPWSHCFGCGPANPEGLHVRSYAGDGEYLCHFTPAEHHSAGPKHFVNGGIIATVIDCHCVFTALADFAQREGIELDSKGHEPPPAWFVTGTLTVEYLRPTPMGEECELRARVVEVNGKSSRVACSLGAGGKETARGEVVAVRVPNDWVDGP